MGFSHTARRRSSAFPRCKLHGIYVVDSFPPECPYQNEFPGDVLNGLYYEGQARIGRADPSGLDLLDRVRICETCQLPRHVLDRLRPRAETPAPPPVRHSPSSRPVAMRVQRKRP